jgi:hypothetical protein
MASALGVLSSAVELAAAARRRALLEASSTLSVTTATVAGARTASTAITSGSASAALTAAHPTVSATLSAPSVVAVVTLTGSGDLAGAANGVLSSPAFLTAVSGTTPAGGPPPGGPIAGSTNDAAGSLSASGIAGVVIGVVAFSIFV